MATTGNFNGTLLGVYIGSSGSETLIAYATECSVSLSLDTFETTSKDSSGWRSLKPGLRSGSVSCQGLATLDGSNDYDALFDAFNNRTTLSLLVETADAADPGFSASAIITSLEMSAPMEDVVSYSATFELSGTITYAV